jgi:GNAT superfamily N-acetyltransferase
MRIHITGASGSGTSTLGAALAGYLRIAHLDADDFYWLPTVPPYTAKRDPAGRLSLLVSTLREAGSSILSGSVMQWGRDVEDTFDLVVFLYLDAPIRVERLRRREIEKLGHADPEFLEWAAQYDAGPKEGRSLARHRAWLQDRRCPVLELAGDMSVRDRVAAVVARMPGLGLQVAAMPSGTLPGPSVALKPALQSDFEDLAALRIEAMRASLERVGRFDPVRARERLRSGFLPAHTHHIEVDGERVGFVMTRPQGDHVLLDHLYVHPRAQGKGIGGAVLAQILAEADLHALMVRVAALRDSDSNRFYARYGFQLVEQGEFDNFYVRPGRMAR